MMQKKCLSILLVLLFVCGATSGSRAAEGRSSGILYTKPLDAVLFSHQSHTGKNMTCVACHSGLFEMEALNAQKKKDFNMESLYRGKYCGACHDGKNAFASDTQCARCHVGFSAPAPQKEAPPYRNLVPFGRTGEAVTFRHETHVQKNACRVCHSSLFKPQEGADKITMADHEKNRFCFTCHSEEGKKAFAWSDCNKCHVKSVPSPREAVTFGKGKKAILFRHETHKFKEGCQSCHPKLFTYRKGTEKIDFEDHLKARLCFTCHAPKNGTAFYDCHRCHSDKPSIKPGTFMPDTLKYTTSMKSVYFHHISHATFTCNQCHASPFAMKKGQTKMPMSEMYKGKFCGTCHNGSKAFDIQQCAKCHK